MVCQSIVVGCYCIVVVVVVDSNNTSGVYKNKLFCCCCRKVRLFQVQVGVQVICFSEISRSERKKAIILRVALRALTMTADLEMCTCLLSCRIPV